MSQPLRQNAVGVILTLTIIDQAGEVIDLSTATLTDSLYLRSPSGRVLTVTPSFVTDGTDGQITYSTQAGDLTEVGPWKAQYLMVIGGVSIPSAVMPLSVQDVIYP